MIQIFLNWKSSFITKNNACISATEQKNSDTRGEIEASRSICSHDYENFK